MRRRAQALEQTYLPPLASASHFFMKEFFAAPARGVPFLSMALSAHPDVALESASHFLIDEAFAAPASGNYCQPNICNKTPRALEIPLATFSSTSQNLLYIKKPEPHKHRMTA